MADRFEYITFGACNIDDSFFDSLKADYPKFSEWFQRKAQEKEYAYVYRENNKIYAFGYLKDENEEINLSDKVLPMENRLKIGTLKIEETLRGKRLGEGILGIALWQWQESGFNQVYVTVFEKHQSLIQLLDKFGFKDSGINLNGEHVFIKDKRHLEYSTPYKSFPFINPIFTKAGMLPIFDRYHDTLFPYSKLARKNQETLNLAVANGISKV
jgi:L-amino acid N-acyltransferase YncA